MATEPGIIGKIGLNSACVGVCLNLLTVHPALAGRDPRFDGPVADVADRMRSDRGGMPVHVLLRMCLDVLSLDMALRAVCGAPRSMHTQSHFLLANDAHESRMLELSGGKNYLARTRSGAVAHTNHYLGFGIDPRQSLGGVMLHGGTENSVRRLSCACELMDAINREPDISKVEQLEAAKETLTDQADQEFPIMCPFVPDEVLGLVLGTVFSVVMDFSTRMIHVTKGSPIDNQFTTLTLQSE